MELRLVLPSDYDALWPILQEAFASGDTYAVDPDIDRNAALQMWCAVPQATFVAVSDGHLLGTYYIKTNQQGGGAHICNCGYIVSKAARRQGLARRMCAASQDQARTMGYTAMQFNFVLASNAGAIALWQDMGFQTVGRIPAAFDHPQAGMVDALVMHKPL